MDDWSTQHEGTGVHRLTALQMAAGGGHAEVCEHLLDSGAHLTALSDSTHGSAAQRAAVRPGSGPRRTLVGMLCDTNRCAELGCAVRGQ